MELLGGLGVEAGRFRWLVLHTGLSGLLRLGGGLLGGLRRLLHGARWTIDLRSLADGLGELGGFVGGSAGFFAQSGRLGRTRLDWSDWLGWFERFLGAGLLLGFGGEFGGLLRLLFECGGLGFGLLLGSLAEGFRHGVLLLLPLRSRRFFGWSGWL